MALAMQWRAGGQGRGEAWLVAAGAAVLAMTLAWTFVASFGRDASPLPQAQLLVGCAAAFVVGRVLGRDLPVALPAAVAATIVVAYLLAPGALSGQATAPPLGYGNANGALAALAVGAACLAAAGAASSSARQALLLLAAAGMWVTWRTDSSAAVVMAAVTLVTGAVGWRIRSRAPVLVLSGLAVAAVGITIGLGAAYAPGRDDPQAVVGVADYLLSDTRLDLWSDALAITADSPLRGVGPGRFATASPTAGADPDIRESHSLVLGQAAELGLPGAALVAALGVWAVAAVWVAPRTPAVKAAGAAVVATLGVQAAIDYTERFPAVSVTAAVLVGVATAALTQRSDRGPLPGPRHDRDPS